MAPKGQEFATIWLGAFDEDEDNDGEDTRWITKQAKQKYPRLVAESRHGDMLENTSESGYRSSGVYMISREGGKGFRVIPLCTDFDDYGSVSACFKGITQFAINYWDYDKMTCIDLCGQKNKPVPNSYWHGENCVVQLGDISAAENESFDVETNTLSFDFNGKQYKIKGPKTVAQLQEFGLVEATSSATTGTCEDYM
eukprot:m.15156 g.15156  ORF g.15156 m.15156 type:complete len:197 (+) comp5306_c0_seq1:80-670(+)